MKFGCYPPLKTVVSHNDKGSVFPLEAAGAIFHIICAAPSVQLGAILWKSLCMQDFCFDIIVRVLIINVCDSHCGLNVPFGIVSALHTCGIKTDHLGSERLCVQVDCWCVWRDE